MQSAVWKYMKGCMDDLIKDKTTPLAYLASFLKLRNSFAVIIYCFNVTPITPYN